jgi:hypothetical protein
VKGPAHASAMYGRDHLSRAGWAMRVLVITTGSLFRMRSRHAGSPTSNRGTWHSSASGEGGSNTQGGGDTLSPASRHQHTLQSQLQRRQGTLASHRPSHHSSTHPPTHPHKFAPVHVAVSTRGCAGHGPVSNAPFVGLGSTRGPSNKNTHRTSHPLLQPRSPSLGATHSMRSNAVMGHQQSIHDCKMGLARRAADVRWTTSSTPLRVAWAWECLLRSAISSFEWTPPH